MKFAVVTQSTLILSWGVRLVAAAFIYLPSDSGSVAFSVGRSSSRSRSFVHQSAVKPSGDAAEEQIPTALFPEKLNIIYDSKCSVCRMEVDFLRSRMEELAKKGGGGGADLFRFTDLESVDGYDASDPRNGGISYEDSMRTFMAVRPDGSILHGISVFREAYDIADLGWVFALTRTPLIGKVADAAYKLFAKYRTDLTRGAPVEELIKRYYEEERRSQKSDAEEGGDCIPCREKLKGD